MRLIDDRPYPLPRLWWRIRRAPHDGAAVALELRLDHLPPPRLDNREIVATQLDSTIELPGSVAAYLREAFG